MNSKEKKKNEKIREEIIMAVPSFINQVLLFLSSGMVLQEALEAVALRYGDESFKQRNYFTDKVYEIYKETEDTGDSFLSAFCKFGRGSKVKELSRLAGILEDSRDRGTNMWDKLVKEGEGMWSERKRRAEERIRIAESKMSFPLGLMLTALVIITAAPAMLQMYID